MSEIARNSPKHRINEIPQNSPPGEAAGHRTPAILSSSPACADAPHRNSTDMCSMFATSLRGTSSRSSANI